MRHINSGKLAGYLIALFCVVSTQSVTAVAETKTLSSSHKIRGPTIKDTLKRCAKRDRETVLRGTAESLKRLLPSLPKLPQTRFICRIQLDSFPSKKIASSTDNGGITREHPTLDIFGNVEMQRWSEHIYTVAAEQGSDTIEENIYVLEKSPLDYFISEADDSSGKIKNAMGEAVANYNEGAERENIISGARFLFGGGMDGRLERLDDILSHFRTTQDRTKSGVHKLFYAYLGLGYVSKYIYRPDSLVEAGLKRADRLQSLRPNSVSPKLIKASILCNHAVASLVDRRGYSPKNGGPINVVARLHRAQQYLDEIRSVAEVDPQWYVLALELQSMQDVPLSKLYSLVEEGSERFPINLHIYSAAANAIARLSKTPYDDLDKLARIADRKAAKSEGEDAYYARMYWLISKRFSGLNGVSATNFDPKKFANGVRKIVARYPIQWNYQNLAAIACATNNKDLTRTLFEKIRGRLHLGAWVRLDVHHACKRWAFDETDAVEQPSND